MSEELDHLEGEVLSEGLLDKIKNIWNKFKNFLARMWKKMKSLIGDSWSRLLMFLDLEPMVYFNNTPRW